MRRYRNQAAVAVAALMAAASGAAMAEDAAAKPAMSKFDEMLDSAGLTVSGYVAASYYASNGYPFNIHQFDVEHNSFQLDQAGLQAFLQALDTAREGGLRKMHRLGRAAEAALVGEGDEMLELAQLHFAFYLKRTHIFCICQ